MPERALDRDRMLDDISLYWLTRTGAWYWNEVDRGGHFAAWEQPELFVQEVRAFFRLVR